MFNWNKHKIIMVRILKDIYQDILISSFLGLKGGTACHLFYGLNRYSVDLDFDLLKPELKETVFQEIEKIAKKHATIKEKYIKKILFSFCLVMEKRNIILKLKFQQEILGIIIKS